MWSLFHVVVVSCGRRFKSVKSSWLASPMMPLDTAPPMMPARSHQGQSNPPTAIGRTATEAVGRHRRFGYAKWGGSEHFSRTARVDPAEARQMVARLAEAAVSVAAKGRAHPSGPSQERNAPREA